MPAEGFRGHVATDGSSGYPWKVDSMWLVRGPVGL